MKKSLFLFAILLIGALTISASIEEQILGKWYVHSIKMEENEEKFSDQDAAPWMEFQEENILLLGEPGRDPEESGWKYNKDRGTLSLDSFGAEFEFKVSNLTESQLVLTAGEESEILMTLVLKREL